MKVGAGGDAGLMSLFRCLEMKDQQYCLLRVLFHVFVAPLPPSLFPTAFFVSLSLALSLSLSLPFPLCPSSQCQRHPYRQCHGLIPQRACPGRAKRRAEGRGSRGRWLRCSGMTSVPDDEERELRSSCH